MEIKVIGTGCEKCSQLYEDTKQAVARLELDATVEKVEDLMEIVRLGVTGLPAVKVDQELIIQGEETSVDSICARLTALTEG